MKTKTAKKITKRKVTSKSKLLKLPPKPSIFVVVSYEGGPNYELDDIIEKCAAPLEQVGSGFGFNTNRRDLQFEAAPPCKTTRRTALAAAARIAYGALGTALNIEIVIPAP